MYRNAFVVFVIPLISCSLLWSQSTDLALGLEPDVVYHSGQVVIVDPDGRYVGFIRPPLNIDQLAQWLPRIMAEE